MAEKALLQVGAKILLCNKDGKFLLLRRFLEKYPEVNDRRWDIVGGRIEAGKPLLENLKREVKEETGLEIEDSPDLVAAQDILRIPGRHIVRLTYIGKAKEGEVVLDRSEHDDFKWHDWQELASLPGIDIYFEELIKNGTIKKELFDKSSNL